MHQVNVIMYLDFFSNEFRPGPLPSNESVGGCYMVPFDLPFGRRRFSSSVGTESFTSPEVSTNRFLVAFIPDIVTRTIIGFDCIDAQSQTLRNVLICAGFFATI